MNLVSYRYPLDDIDAGEIIEDLVNRLKSSRVEQLLMQIQEAIAEYDFELALKKLMRLEELIDQS